MQTPINVSFLRSGIKFQFHCDIMICLYITYYVDNSSFLNTTGGWSDTTSICAEGFYLENNSQSTMCTPLCNFWVSSSKLSTAEDVLFLIVMFVSVASSVVLFIVAVRFQRDTIVMMLPDA